MELLGSEDDGCCDVAAVTPPTQTQVVDVTEAQETAVAAQFLHMLLVCDLMSALRDDKETGAAGERLESEMFFLDFINFLSLTMQYLLHMQHWE